MDTDVVVAGLRSPTGASAELLRMARKVQVTLLVSVPLFVEYEAKCLEPSIWPPQDSLATTA